VFILLQIYFDKGAISYFYVFMTGFSQLVGVFKCSLCHVFPTLIMDLTNWVNETSVKLVLL